MREKRRYNFSQRVFSKNDVRVLANIVTQLAADLDNADRRVRLEFELVSADGTSYTSDSSADVLADESAIDTKSTQAFEITLNAHQRSSVLDRAIRISLTHGDRSGTLAVSGEDSTWVSGTFGRLKEVIDNAPPQAPLLLKFKTPILHVLAIGIGHTMQIVVAPLIVLVLRGIEHKPSPEVASASQYFAANPLAATLAYLVAVWLSGILPAISVRDWLLDLWPSIELDTGPQHLKKQQQRRKRLSFVVTAIALPVVLQAVYDFSTKR